MRHPNAAVPLILAVASCGGGGPKVALRYRPPAGAVYHLGVEQRTTVSADSGPLAKMGKAQVLMRVYFTQTVKGPASGGTEVEVLFESMTMEIPGIRSDVIGSALAGLQGMKGTMVVDERGKVLRSRFAPGRGVSPDITQRLADGVTSMAFEFPEHPVGRGDSWTVTTDLPLDQVPGISASTTEVARTTLTVREFRVNGADTSVVIDIKTEFPTDPIRLASAEESGSITLEGGITGHQLFSLSRGVVTDANLKGTAKMRFAGGSVGSPGMSMRTETENSIVLLPK